MLFCGTFPLWFLIKYSDGRVTTFGHRTKKLTVANLEGVQAMMWSFLRKSKDVDFSKFFGSIQSTPKQLLLEECKKNGVSVYVDEASETSTGFYAKFRVVASEAELEKRLNVELAVCQARLANRIAIFALVFSLVALVKSFYSS
jgi:hypothetical protein